MSVCGWQVWTVGKDWLTLWGSSLKSVGQQECRIPFQETLVLHFGPTGRGPPCCDRMCYPVCRGLQSTPTWLLRNPLGSQQAPSLILRLAPPPHARRTVGAQEPRTQGRGGEQRVGLREQGSREALG